MSVTRPPTARPTMTVDEFWEFCQRPENADRRFELIRGGVIEVSQPTRLHSIVANRIGSLLDRWAEASGSGYAATETGVVLEDSLKSVVGPDVSFFTGPASIDDIPPKWGDDVPVLAVEVLSPNDRPGAVNRKVHDYLSSGVRVVWLVDPEERTVTVYRPAKTLELFDATGTLVGADDLPGLSVPVADIFRLPGEKRPA
jgi:Uma2 family endonuclease